MATICKKLFMLLSMIVEATTSMDRKTSWTNPDPTEIEDLDGMRRRPGERDHEKLATMTVRYHQDKNDEDHKKHDGELSLLTVVLTRHLTTCDTGKLRSYGAP
ncbi:unnamed protein product [Linum trigynum]|uniref:Secreted protein n=1 Tax=Linum trigynum TaxID=586398 RepID=A0AAV2CUM7_9ROSI